MARTGLRSIIRSDDPLGALRLATFLLVGVSILGLFTIEPKPVYGAALVFVAIGSWFSHWHTGRNRIVKTFLAIGMLYLLYEYLANISLYIQDTRLPLARLLLWLQVLNAFDLPRRYNLRIAQMVGAILMIVTASLSRDLVYGLVLGLFTIAAVVCGHLGLLAEFKSPPRLKGIIASGIPVIGVVAVLSAVLFMLVPRGAGGYLKQLPMSGMITLPSAFVPKILSPAYPAGQGSGGGNTVNPNAYYGFAERLDLDYRGRLGNEVAIKIRSNRSEYWKGMAYDRYDGRGWSMTHPNEVRNLKVDSLPFNLPGDALSGGGPSQVRTVYVEREQSNLILLPPNTRQLYFPSNLIFQDRYGGYRSPVILDKGLYYSVLSEAVAWDEGILKEAFSISMDMRHKLSNYLDLPPSFPPRARQLAGNLVAHAKGPYGKVVAIRDYLLKAYPYDLDVPHFPPNSDQVDHFLFVSRRGYCEHFASALGLMAREVGVPSRLATGYLPGHYNPFTGFWDVRTSDAHAWTECYFGGIGWVPFDATPGSPTPTKFMDDQNAPPALALVGYAYERLGLYFWLLLGGIILAVGLLGWAFSPGVVAVRQLKKSSPSRSAYLASVAYLRLLGLLRRYGLERRTGWTPQEHADAVRTHPILGRVAGKLDDFVAGYEAARFGATLTEDLDARLSDIKKDLAAKP